MSSPPPPPPSSGKIYSPPINPNDDLSTSRPVPSTTSLVNVIDDDVGGNAAVIAGTAPIIEKNNHRLLCSTLINGPLSVHPNPSISLTTTDNITLTNPNTTLLYHGEKTTTTSENDSEEKLKNPG